MPAGRPPPPGSEGVAPGWVSRIAATPAAEQVAMIRAAGS